MYTETLNAYKNELGKYPSLLDDLIPKYVPSLSVFQFSSSDPYLWDAIKKYYKDTGENPSSLEALVPNYFPDISFKNWEYTCDPNGMTYKLSITSEVSIYRHSFWFGPEGCIFQDHGSVMLR